jgi:hypothetical protein
MVSSLMLLRLLVVLLILLLSAVGMLTLVKSSGNFGKPSRVQLLRTAASTSSKAALVSLEEALLEF